MILLKHLKTGKDENEFDVDAMANYNVLRFPAYDMQWLEFVVSNRHGDDAAKGYDAVEGGVANDRLQNTKTNFYFQSVGYVASFLKNEVENAVFC